MFSLDLSALRKRKVMEATRRSSTCTGLTEDFMSTVSVSAPDPPWPKAGMWGCSLPGVLPRHTGNLEICGHENVMRCHGLKWFHPKWWCLSYWRSFQIGGTLLFDVIWLDESFPSDHSLSTELYSSVAIDLSSIEVKVVVSNMFKLCSPVQFDSQVQNQVAYISSCWSIWGNVYLRNSCLAHSVSSQRWDKLR